MSFLESPYNKVNLINMSYYIQNEKIKEVPYTKYELP